MLAEVVSQKTRSSQNTNYKRARGYLTSVALKVKPAYNAEPLLRSHCSFSSNLAIEGADCSLQKSTKYIFSIGYLKKENRGNRRKYRCGLYHY